MRQLAIDVESSTAGFARIERYFELQQAQFVEWRDEVRGEFAQLRGRVDALSVARSPR